MSYDLIFTAATGAGPITQESFIAYFGGREHYEINGSQAWYSNEDTGVYFVFEFEHDPETIEFHLNLYRPSFFALEAAPELESFAGHFNAAVEDLQLDEMVGNTFHAEDFVRGWNSSNARGSLALRQDGGLTPPAVYPRARLLEIWQWNFTRARRQLEIRDEVFVPRISFANHGGEVRSWAIWPDAIRTLLPRVDDVVIVREELARRRWFRRKEETVIAPWEAIGPNIHANYTAPPPEIVALATRDWPPLDKKTFVAVSPDSVLDAELFA